jgi:hypothetical protein
MAVESVAVADRAEARGIDPQVWASRCGPDLRYVACASCSLLGIAWPMMLFPARDEKCSSSAGGSSTLTGSTSRAVR